MLVPILILFILESGSGLETGLLTETGSADSLQRPLLCDC